jgi:hypothetical protein
MNCSNMLSSIRPAVALALLGTVLLPGASHAAKPLRVFIRASEKTHGPGAHDYPRFLQD